jgi:hypothetical protein
LWHALIADLVDALSLLASTSQSKDWKSLPRPVVECIKVLGVRVAKETGFDQQKFYSLDQGEAASSFSNIPMPPRSRTTDNQQRSPVQTTKISCAILQWSDSRKLQFDISGLDGVAKSD